MRQISQTKRLEAALEDYKRWQWLATIHCPDEPDQVVLEMDADRGWLWFQVKISEQLYLREFRDVAF
ncbi:MAG: hypothetical protein HC879_09285 [Leptolyngbyaceae cyanobacterium SL_5_9]|nr:hypothetical protein [Leptolyngbyaceae cyanobacterium SL_5_9]NJO72357.1 hypothetical protein [Leptolyngbyaceae cyanobacterium RM1_406_9]